MTAIAPNTVIRMGQIYLQSGSEDTFYFDSVADQTSFMTANLTHVFTKFTYQREHRNYVKIEITSEQDADKWDYMMFQNTSYGDKWFYAFITETEWINNLTVKVYYEIDYMQTYWGETNLYPSYVERMHNATDDIGDNITPDVFVDDEYVMEESTIQNLIPRTSSLLIAVMYIPQSNRSDVKLYRDIPCGYNIRLFQGGDVSGITSFINGLTDINQVMAIYTVPSIILQAGVYPASGGEDITSLVLTSNLSASAMTPTTLSLINGYRPANNKLYTYPYTLLRVTNDKGEYVNYRYELFHNRTPQFEADISGMIPPTVVLAPTNYNGLSNVKEPNQTIFYMTDKTKQITLTDYPQGSWKADTYTNWATFQGLPNLIAGLGASAVTAAINPTAGVMSAASTIMGTMVGAYTNRIKADKVNGTVNVTNTSTFYNRKNFIACRMSVKYNVAEMIDNYFTMFGYAQNKIMTPSRKVRSRFTYIKTVDAIVYGELPNNAKNAITALYNRGIRFWADKTNFRNYSLANNTL